MDVKEMALGGVAPSKRTWVAITRDTCEVRDPVGVADELRDCGQDGFAHTDKPARPSEDGDFGGSVAVREVKMAAMIGDSR